MAPRVALLLGLLALATVVVSALAPAEPRRAGTNNVPLAGPAAKVAPRGELCQPENVPDDARVVRLWVDRPRGARPVVRVDGRGPVVVGRGSPAGADGVTDVALDRAPAAGQADLCIRNRGSEVLVLSGYPAGAEDGTQAGPIRVDFYRAGEESWFAVGGVVAERMGFGKSGLFGSWSLWVAAALALAALALAAAALWRVGDAR